MLSASSPPRSLSSTRKKKCFKSVRYLLLRFHDFLALRFNKEQMLKDRLVVAVGPGYWMLCFSIKREREKHHQLVCVCVCVVGTNTLCVDKTVDLSLLRARSRSGESLLCPLSCLAFRGLCRGRGNTTWNAGDANFTCELCRKTDRVA